MKEIFNEKLFSVNSDFTLRFFPFLIDLRQRFGEGFDAGGRRDDLGENPGGFLSNGIGRGKRVRLEHMRLCFAVR
jgi:hypothetical protein